MGNKSKMPSESAILEAIEGSGAIVSTIAAKLRVTWNTAEKYVNHFESTQRAMQDEREKVLDMAEGTILKSIKSGDSPDSKWYLSKKGKHRGYTDRTEISGPDGGAIRTESGNEGLENLSREEIRLYLELERKRRGKKEID